jgi:hypothetical protein
MRVRPGVKYNLSMFARRGTAMRRRVIVRKDDVLVVDGLELDASILRAMLEPDKRILWAFVRSEDGESIQPLAISEERCIWLEPTDLERKELPSGV